MFCISILCFYGRVLVPFYFVCVCMFAPLSVLFCFVLFYVCVVAAVDGVVAAVVIVVAADVALFSKFAPGMHLHRRFVFVFLLYARSGALRPCFLENARLWSMGSICWGLYGLLVSFFAVCHGGGFANDFGAL